MSETTAIALDSSVASAIRPPRRYLHNRWFDFLTLGGGSLIVMAAMAAFYPRTEAAMLALGAITLLLCHFVDHPHFAHSYQLFYRGFRKKAFSKESVLFRRYQLAGIGVPALLLVFFGIAIAHESAALLGLAANVMFFTVGWHYAKQGFGILMVDAAHTGTRFDQGQRRRLLFNTHLTWLTYWLFTNNAVAAHNYWGLTYFVFDTPDAILAALLAGVAVSTLLVARDFYAKWRTDGTLPGNGLVAYAVAVYIWLPIGLVDAVVLLIVPFFHSLQYLSVVWRYQINLGTDGAHGAERPGSMADDRPRHWPGKARWGMVRFVLVGALLGAVGFWWAPEFLDAHSGIDQGVFGATAFLFMGWTFINIHHYFLDNVIWRRDNPEIRRHLFARAK